MTTCVCEGADLQGTHLLGELGTPWGSARAGSLGVILTCHSRERGGRSLVRAILCRAIPESPPNSPLSSPSS